MKDGVKARYTLEFKREAVRLVHGGENVSAAARMLGVSGQSLDNWVKAEAAGRLRDVRGKAVTAEQMEIARLKAELSRVRMERDILKKAVVGSTGRRNGIDFIISRRFRNGAYRATWSFGGAETRTLVTLEGRTIA